jgi:sugar/nucleoside kinase (ribokinase family)
MMNMPGNRVVVIGNIGIDTNVYLPGDNIDIIHEANFTTNTDIVGQAGGYASRGYRRLGAETAFIGSIGADWMGDHIRSVLTKDGIDVRGLFTDPHGTSRSVNLVFPDGTRKNFYDGKSHMTLKVPEEQSLALLQGASLVHFNIPNWARTLLEPARQSGATIACDIQDVMDPADPYRLDFVRGAEYLFFSAANHPDPRPVMEYYLSLNPRLVILATMGAKGCSLATPDGFAHYPPAQLDLPVVDTNGAGDAFATGFLVSRVIEQRTLEDAVRRAQICARHKCAQKSSSSNMITRELLEHYASMMD